jgi:hypothetical protein
MNTSSEGAGEEAADDLGKQKRPRYWAKGTG